MIHPIKSVVARQQSWVLNNFEKTKYSKKIKQLNNSHNGERCFIVANGPSLTADDLDVLNRNNEYTFGMNRIFKIFNQTDWRPDCYACEDIMIFNDCVDEINDIESAIKFIPINHHFYNHININGAYYFKANYNSENDYPNSFSTEISRQMDSVGTVTFTCINIAAYMGFKEIYLIGVDHNYKVTMDENGNTTVNEGVKDYFCDNYDNDIKDMVAHNIWNNTRVYQKAKKACDGFGIKIFNATRGGKLEVFPRVDFDSLFI